MANVISIIDRGRGPELAGTRITVFDVLHYHDAGWQPSSIALALGISTQQVDALLRHFSDHEVELRTEQKRIQSRLDEGNPPEIEQRLSESRAKLLKFRESLRKAPPEERNGAVNSG